VEIFALGRFWAVVGAVVEVGQNNVYRRADGGDRCKVGLTIVGVADVGMLSSCLVMGSAHVSVMSTILGFFFCHISTQLVVRVFWYLLIREVYDN
jgi:hypothetical protein